MTTFRYEAKNEQGELVRGELQAENRADAAQRLRDGQLEPLDITEVSPVAKEAVEAEAVEAEAVEAVSAQPLTRREAEVVMAHVAQLSGASLPLAAGLRAAASESGNRRVARALRLVAADLDQGHSLEAILKQRAQFLPEFVRGLLLATVRTGRPGEALEELVDHERTVRDMFWGLVGAVAYPLIVLGLALALLAVLPVLIVPEFKKMFEEFELELPTMTRFLIYTSDFFVFVVTRLGVWVLLFLVAFLAVLRFGVPGLFSTASAQHLRDTLPILGPLWHWSGAASFCRLLAILVEHGVPMSESLRLTADGVRHAPTKEIASLLSEGAAQGRTLSDMLSDSPWMPTTMVPLVRWGEKTGELPDALRTASDMFVGRIRLRALLLRSISAPIVFVLVVLVVSFTVISLFLPLFNLIQGLS
jgi:type II secretory pathway component PulF